MDTLVTPTAVSPGIATVGYNGYPGYPTNATLPGAEVAHFNTAAVERSWAASQADAHFVRDSVERSIGLSEIRQAQRDLISQNSAILATVAGMKGELFSALNSMEISRLKDALDGANQKLLILETKK